MSLSDTVKGWGKELQDKMNKPYDAKKGVKQHIASKMGADINKAQAKKAHESASLSSKGALAKAEKGEKANPASIALRWKADSKRAKKDFAKLQKNPFKDLPITAPARMAYDKENK